MKRTPSGDRPEDSTRHMLELLDVVHELLDRHDLRHWLDCGTLLGAVRNGKFIPWDDDIDVSVLAADAGPIRELVPEIEAAGFYCNVEPHGARIHYSTRKYGLFLDLLRWSPQDGLLVHGGSTQWDWPGMQDRGFFPAEYVEELDHVELYGRSFPAPSRVHEFLRDYRYGADYMTPRRKALRLHQEIPLTSEDFTPAASELYDAVALREEQVFRAARSRFLVHRMNLVGIDQPLSRFIMALPSEPSPERLAAILHEIPERDRTPTVEHLARMKATLDTAFHEIDNPSPRLAFRRMRRRSSRMLEFVAGRTVNRARRERAST